MPISLAEMVQLAIELTLRAERAEARARELETQLAQALQASSHTHDLPPRLYPLVAEMDHDSAS